MAVQTRRMRAAKKPSSAAKKSYRRRVKLSPCRAKKAYACAASPKCKMTKGKKRSFCRKKSNTRRSRRI